MTDGLFQPDSFRFRPEFLSRLAADPFEVGVGQKGNFSLAERVLKVQSDVLDRLIAGKPLGPESSTRKALSDPHGQHIFQIARDLSGSAGLLADVGPLGADPMWWANGFLFAPALTIGGGTSEVLRNVIGERILGLPREPDPDAGRAWTETRRTKGAQAK